MSKWESVVVEDIKSDTPKALVGGPFGSNLVSRDYVENGIPVIRGSNMGQGRWVVGPFAYVSKEKASELSGNTARPGDLVFTQRGTLGQVCLVPQEPLDAYIISQSQMKLTPDRSKADGLFLYYVFSSPTQQHYIQQNAIQTGVPHTNLGILRETPLELPPLPAQQRIAHILGTLDDKIELNRRMNRTLEAIARAVFKSWFVDFLPVRAKIAARTQTGDPVHARAEGREPTGMDPETAALFPDSLQDSPLGKIPKGWEVGVLGDLCEVQIGGDWGKDEPFEGGIEVRCLRGVDLGHLRDDGAAPAPVRWIKQASFDKRGMSAQDVLIAASGAGPLGRVLWVSPDLADAFQEPILYSNFCKRLRADTEAEAIYLDAVLAEMRESGEIWDFSTGTSVPNLDMSGLLESREVAIPQQKALESFSKVVRPLWARRYSQENERLGLIRDSLLPKLLTGLIALGADDTDTRRVDGN